MYFIWFCRDLFLQAQQTSVLCARPPEWILNFPLRWLAISAHKLWQKKQSVLHPGFMAVRLGEGQLHPARQFVTLRGLAKPRQLPSLFSISHISPWWACGSILNWESGEEKLSKNSCLPQSFISCHSSLGWCVYITKHSLSLLPSWAKRIPGKWESHIKKYTRGYKHSNSNNLIQTRIIFTTSCFRTGSFTHKDGKDCLISQSSANTGSCDE